MAMLRSLMLLLILFSMGNAKVDKVKKCPYGWTNFGVRCFKFFSQLADWVTAERNCQKENANLASVCSKLENDFLLSLLPMSSTQCWIGAHDGEQEGQWLWNDGTFYGYTNWCHGEPNNNNPGPEHCVEISWSSNRCWNDEKCSTLMGYVCAKDL